MSVRLTLDGCPTPTLRIGVASGDYHWLPRVGIAGGKRILDTYPRFGVFELDPLFQKPGVGIMSSTATCVLPMKLGPKLVTRQSNSSPRFEFSRRII
jgi:hypothetical protein